MIYDTHIDHFNLTNSNMNDQATLMEWLDTENKQ